jgi:WD40 repeat protein
MLDFCLHSLVLFASIVLFSGMSFAQSAMLSYRPNAAEFSPGLNRIIMVSGNPNTLHVYDPVSGNEETVGLVQPPLSLSLSPDGFHAVVGHDALLSYVNLVLRSVEKTYVVPATADKVVLSSSWIYVLPTRQGSSVSVNIASGVVTPNNSVFFTNATGARLNTAVNAIYGTRDGTSPNDIEEYDISTGPITKQFDSPYHGDYCIFGPVWFSPDGSRIYTGCGTVFHASKNPQLDMYYMSSLQGVSSIGAFAESAAINRFALIAGAPVYPSTTTNDGTVLLFESTYLKSVGQFVLPSFSVNSVSFQAHGKWVFFNAASTELYVLMEADPKSGLLNDFALQRIPLSVPDSCGAAFASATASVGATGSQGTVKIIASPDCIYQAASLSSWVQILSGGYGSGNGVLTYIARPNSESAGRSAVISMGGQTFTINQDGNSTTGGVAWLGYNVIDAAYNKPLDKIVLVASNPDELHIYDPVTRVDQTVPLVKPPLCVSVRPDGMYAAVGHDGWVSYVNLQTGSVEKIFQVVTDVHTMVLAGNGYMYLFPARSWSDMYSLEISSGIVTATNAIYDGRVPRLYVNGKYLYVGGDASSKWDISRGVAKLAGQSFGVSTCGNLWLTEDGRRLFTACAKAYTTSEIPAQDSQYNGTLSAAAGVVWADESAQQQATAVIPFAGYSNGGGSVPAGDTQVQIYGDAFLGFNGAIPLPQFANGDKVYATHGRFVFWNRAATALVVVVQADSAAQLLAGSGITQVLPSAAQQVTVTAVVNAASQASSRIAPGEIITITGSGFGPSNGA